MLSDRGQIIEIGRIGSEFIRLTIDMYAGTINNFVNEVNKVLSPEFNFKQAITKAYTFSSDRSYMVFWGFPFLDEHKCVLEYMSEQGSEGCLLFRLSLYERGTVEKIVDSELTVTLYRTNDYNPRSINITHENLHFQIGENLHNVKTAASLIKYMNEMKVDYDLYKLIREKTNIK